MLINIGIFTGLALLGVAEYVDARGIVVGLEHPEYAHFWENVGLKHAKKVTKCRWRNSKTTYF